jgi:hypothetical protein
MKPPDSEATPAELLRRAALSTRKFKRRKLESTPSVPLLPARSLASTPSISLDYGQEDPSSPPPSTTLQPASPAPARVPTPTKTVVTPSSPPRAVQRDSSDGAAALGDDTSMREEGEISDNEDPPFRPPSKPNPAPITVTGMAYPDIKLEPRGFVQSPSPFGIVSRSPSVTAEDAYQRVTSRGPGTTSVRRLSVDGQPASLQTRTSSDRLETPHYILDPDHVRPGLSCPFI